MSELLPLPKQIIILGEIKSINLLRKGKDISYPNFTILKYSFSIGVLIKHAPVFHTQIFSKSFLLRYYLHQLIEKFISLKLLFSVGHCTNSLFDGIQGSEGRLLKVLPNY